MKIVSLLATYPWVFIEAVKRREAAVCRPRGWWEGRAVALSSTRQGAPLIQQWPGTRRQRHCGPPLGILKA
jgi:hypothetical protein